MSKKIVMITGGTGDIGTAIAKELSPHFEYVVALDISPYHDGSVWQDDLKKQNFNNVLYRQLDVANFQQCDTVISQLIQELGRVDALVNNAGITRDAVFYKMTKQDWDDVLRVNLDGMFNVTRQVVEAMTKQESGRIINISSVNAQKGQFSQTNYAASKAGIYGFTKTWPKN